jgi:hypothetical protein
VSSGPLTPSLTSLSKGLPMNSTRVLVLAFALALTGFAHSGVAGEVN